MAVAGDVNGDGKADFIVGARRDDPAGGGLDAGSAYAFSGADGSLLYQVTGDTAGDEFGVSVSIAGDVNGDGRADFIVGAHLGDPVGGGSNAGSTYVFSGADGSILYHRTGDSVEDRFGWSVSGAGDVNGDGRADFIVGATHDDPAGIDSGSAYVFSGADGSLLYQVTGDTSFDFFGYSVSGAGDVNGDGRADFIVGAHLGDPVGGGSNAGSTYVFSGADGSILYHRTGDSVEDRFGWSVSGAGDVNGDGRADFIVGATHDDPAGIDSGSAYVFSGADGSLLYQVTGDTSFDFFGYSVSGAGDVNGDGRADFIVGAYLDNPAGGGEAAGSAYVFSGADGSLLYQRTGDTASDQFGWSVAGAGDVNWDGKADFIVGAYKDDPAGGGLDAGSAYVFSGADGSLLYQRTGDTANDRFGVSVSGAGDVNGDGRADFIVGAYLDDPGGASDAGIAYVFSGADGSLLYQVTGDSQSDWFSWSVSGAGDVNGDGRPDLIVGAYRDNPFPIPAGTSAGSAYVFSGADGSLLYHRTGDAAQDIFGWDGGEIALTPSASSGQALPLSLDGRGNFIEESTSWPDYPT